MWSKGCCAPSSGIIVANHDLSLVWRPVRVPVWRSCPGAARRRNSRQSRWRPCHRSRGQGRIVFAAIDQPVERNSIPPRVMDLDATHIGVLFGASEWRVPADPKPIRLDRNFQRVARGDPRYQSAPGEGETDLETIGIAFLEKLR